MPYKGEQEIVFPQDNYAIIFRINGENMHEKHQLSMLLDGVCMTKLLELIKSYLQDLINIEAQSEGSNI